MNIAQNHATFNILLADDDSDDFLFFKEALKEFSLPTDLTVVHHGEQLMQVLTNEVNKHPQVVFLDLNMPRKNGFECLAEIRLNEKLKHLPVIIYSTSFHKIVADMLYEIGANYYISKPSDITMLKKAVQNIINHIAMGNIQQPNKETFLLTEERKNSKTFGWFKGFFTLPDSTNLR